MDKEVKNYSVTSDDVKLLKQYVERERIGKIQFREDVETIKLAAQRKVDEIFTLSRKSVSKKSALLIIMKMMREFGNKAINRDKSLGFYVSVVDYPVPTGKWDKTPEQLEFEKIGETLVLTKPATFIDKLKITAGESLLDKKVQDKYLELCYTGQININTSVYLNPNLQTMIYLSTCSLKACCNLYWEVENNAEIEFSLHYKS